MDNRSFSNKIEECNASEGSNCSIPDFPMLPERSPPRAPSHLEIPSTGIFPRLTELTTSSPKPSASREHSSAGSTRSTQSYNLLENMKHEVMVNYLFQQQCARGWIQEGNVELEGVVVRKSRGNYMTCPPALLHSTFALYCAQLNFQVAMTINSRVIKTFLQWSPNADDIPLTNGLRVQVLPTLEELHRAKKNQYAAIIAADALLVVWDDEPMHIVNRASAIEDQLLQLVWKADNIATDTSRSKTDLRVQERDIDVEKDPTFSEKRPTYLINAILVSCTLCIIMVMFGAGCRQLVMEVVVDRNFIRLALLAMTPIQVFFTLFFVQVIVGCVAQCIGPVKQMTTNSYFYSALPPRRLSGTPLPHITIQCPVYKESLPAVIAPTVRSIKEAMCTYELQGGSCTMFINDDGLQIISEEDRLARINFYADHGIGWTARPKHGDNGFVRRGKFKKASNLNYGLMLSNAVEDKLAKVERHGNWTQTDEDVEYERCLKEVLDDNPQAWSEGNIRIGDYILLIDSDTRVPSDCLLDAASEMERSPSVGILQFSSGVMQVVHTYFENGITFFTNIIYTAIRYSVSNGDVAPFVGHNALLRWSALQAVLFMDEDGTEKYWSESHVSEDFDMSLRLQISGYIIRLAAWAGDGFKEGVSLTVYDELARWEKYAFGCNELLFHPLKDWLHRGPFTELFRRFISSNIRFTSKVTILSYIGTYYAIGGAWLLTSANYFAVGWYNGYLDKWYIDSWKVWFSIVIVFNGLGNISLAALRYRTGEKSFVAALAENFKWLLLLIIFLGGLSLHISYALLSHFFSIDIAWGATAKEAEFSNFFIEVPKVLRRFKWSMAIGMVGIVTLVVLAKGSFVPEEWQITDFVAILPMATVWGSHLLLPVALNPALMTFSW